MQQPRSPTISWHLRATKLPASSEAVVDLSLTLLASEEIVEEVRLPTAKCHLIPGLSLAGLITT